MREDASDEAADLRRRLIQDGGAQADAIGRAAQTRHQELAARSDPDAAAMWEVARAAARASPPRLGSLRLVTITTDCAGSFAAWVASLRAALDDAGWRRSGGPAVEVLRVANDADVEIDAAHRRVVADGITIRVVDVGARRPLPLAEARPYAFHQVREHGWIPSARAPVWSLDEDFRFDTLVPSPRAMFVRRSGGPLLHRLDALVARLAAQGVDVIVGGNTGAAPVPALGLLLGQVRDLAAEFGPAQRFERLLDSLSQLTDGYYDLAEHQSPTLRVPLVRAWWRADGEIDEHEVVGRLQAGLPVTRPALALPLLHRTDAWATHDRAVVAGGNTVMLSPRALDAPFLHVRHGALISRRADTTWAIIARDRGARVARACLPLFHDRQRRPQAPHAAAREALADALGVGVYRSMLAREVTEVAILARAAARIAELRGHLAAAEAIARRATVGRRLLADLADWIAEARAALVLAAAPPTLLGGAHQDAAPLRPSAD